MWAVALFVRLALKAWADLPRRLPARRALLGRPHDDACPPLRLLLWRRTHFLFDLRRVGETLTAAAARGSRTGFGSHQHGTGHSEASPVGATRTPWRDMPRKTDESERSCLPSGTWLVGVVAGGMPGPRCLAGKEG